VQTPAWNELNAPAAKPVVVEPPKRVVAPAVRALFAEFEPPAPPAASAARGQAPVVKVKSPPLEGPARIRALEVIQEEVRGCTRCGLVAKRHNTVFARGNPMARLAFVGEGPGEQEDLQGLPFVGRAGQLLDRIVMGMGLTQDDIYVCNVVKCRPPGNRVPEPDEMTTCGPYLSAQLDLVRPEVIVVLGLTAARYLLKTKSPMSKLRGQWQNYEDIAVMPTWHPAYVLRDMDRPNSTARREVWEDMKLVLAKLGLPVPQK
jgi:DNA polymerase